MTSIAERLELNSIPVPECGCLIWLGAVTCGYGALRVDGKFEYAHRLAWKEKHGNIPEGLFVCHRCDTRPCINTDHLFLGTDLENIADMVAKGRNRLPPPRFALGVADTAAAKSMEGSLNSIAKKFGVTQGTIARIKRLSVAAQ